ncbi:hypothetical protein HanXRQr2_Chr09g0369491 [Helianthus annuus]|uniref:Uncharacterized protein n=1 Tax=Helianthus annuus TaxID=4232 RepID=A0A9K3N7I7_HELAN|nr:hypothetical protein HanXRQr2_Chr09g0369491 [Helianthus annuus]
MLKVALCCVQYRPEARPVMSIIVRMLEGADEPNDSLARMAWNVGGSDWSSSEVVTRSVGVMETPLMKKYEITMASE